jgi:four helix bundle protein
MSLFLVFNYELRTKNHEPIFRGSSSDGRAVRSQRTGQRFDPALLQKFAPQKRDKFLVRGSEFMVRGKRKSENMNSIEKFNFENLRVYQDALDFSKQVYRITKIFPKNELFGLTSQLRRAASSIPLNIAEGSGLTKTEFKNFLRRARGSICECVTILYLALDNGYVIENEQKKLYGDCQKLAKSISALINSIK